MANDAFSLDKLRAMMKEFSCEADKNPITRGILGPAKYHDLYRELPAMPPRYSPETFFGIRVEPSNMFPVTNQCSICQGSGEGATSTYCTHCKGGGKVTYEGMMTSEPPSVFDLLRPMRTVLICSYFPKRFQPRVTFNVPLPRMRGLV